MNLKALRMGKGMTLEELAAKIGKSASAVCLYEQGKREPNLETLRRLAAALGVTVDELIRKGEG